MPSHFRGRQFDNLSGWQDSNLRPPGPKPGAITGLRYIPNYWLSICKNFFRVREWDTIRKFAEPFYQTSSAERVGFEPTVQFNPYDDLANRSFRPLRHLSKIPILVSLFLSSANWRNLYKLALIL